MPSGSNWTMCSCTATSPPNIWPISTDCRSCAFCAAADLTSLADYLAACRILGHLPAAILIDSHRPGQYGGTGEIADWSAVARAKSEWPDVPLVLAGGLKAENVAAAIEAVRPAAVDTASGVEMHRE